MNTGDAVADVRIPIEPPCFPSAEDLRMVRAIALLAFLEAERQGEYHATFRGFRFEADRRHGRSPAASSVEVHLVVTFAGTVVERCALEIGDMRASSSKIECDGAHIVDGETFVG